MIIKKKDLMASVEQMMSRECEFIKRYFYDIDGKRIDFLLFSCEYDDIGTQLRWNVFIDGQRDAGGII